MIDFKLFKQISGIWEMIQPSEAQDEQYLEVYQELYLNKTPEERKAFEEGIKQRIKSEVYKLKAFVDKE